MSKLNPAPGVLILDGAERHLFYDYAAIEKMQDIYNLHPFAIIKMIFADDGDGTAYYKAKPLIDIAHILLNNEVEREKWLNGSTALKIIDREKLGHMIDRDNADSVVAAIISAWNNQMPQTDPEDEEEDESQEGEDP